MKKCLEVIHLKKYFGSRENPQSVLNKVSFDIFEGEFVGIMGASGSGKTTLLNCISGITRPSEGTIKLDGEDVSAFDKNRLASYRGRDLGFIFQEYLLIDSLTLRENILLPLSIQHAPLEDMDRRLEEVAERLKITALLEKFPHQTSGGEKQRAAAARAIITQPKLILADEPTGALDSGSSKTLMEAMSELNRQKRHTILMVTHNYQVAAYCSRILFFKDGEIYHELIRHGEDDRGFEEKILSVIALSEGGRTHVL